MNTSRNKSSWFVVKANRSTLEEWHFYSITVNNREYRLEPQQAKDEEVVSTPHL